ncbi:hypothetical protein [Campylobacter devanensis]|uniref:hypothetical protein n=1 Tax=Campylobacter devanensis TaxID=3161138 RepID=UPI000A353E38|nr:hypothetical protein [Campylobacter sp. P090]
MIKKDKGFLFTNLELIKQTSPNADKRIKEIIGNIIKRLDDNLTSVSKNRYNDELISKFDSFLTTDFIYLEHFKEAKYSNDSLELQFSDIKENIVYALLGIDFLIAGYKQKRDFIRLLNRKSHKSKLKAQRSFKNIIRYQIPKLYDYEGNTQLLKDLFFNKDYQKHFLRFVKSFIIVMLSLTNAIFYNKRFKGKNKGKIKIKATLKKAHNSKQYLLSTIKYNFQRDFLLSRLELGEKLEPINLEFIIKLSADEFIKLGKKANFISDN